MAIGYAMPHCRTRVTRERLRQGLHGAHPRAAGRVSLAAANETAKLIDCR
jgi:hypothetical protein